MAAQEARFLDDDLKRLDGRRLDELGEISIEAGPLGRADGSCYLEWRKNKVYAAVYGPREAHPRHLQDPTKAILRCRYNMAAFSVEDRKRPGPDRRSVEVSKVMGEALESVIFTRQFPRTSIDVFVEVMQADAGTRCAGLTAASVALADAGIPMRGLIAACAAGKIEGHIALDLRKEEDNFGEADLPVAILPRTDEIILLQMDGHLTEDEFLEALGMAMKACHQIEKIEKEALMKKYRVGGEG
jgi:exosome complex component RRP41